MAGQTRSGVSAGQHQESNVQQGTHEYRIHEFTYAKWSAEKVEVGSTVQLEIGIIGAENGGVVPIFIYEKDLNKTDYSFSVINAQVNGGTISVQWKYPYPKLAGKPSYPQYYCKCYNAKTGKFIQSGMLEFYKNITVSVVDSNNRPVANQAYKIVLGTSQILSGQTDSNGKIIVQRKPIGTHFIKFINNPLITPKKVMKIESPFFVSKYPLDCFENPTFYKNDYVVHCDHKINDKVTRYVVSAPKFYMVPKIPKGGTVADPDIVTIISPEARSLSNSNNNPVDETTNTGMHQYSTKVAYTGRCNVTNPFSGDFWTGFFNPTQGEIHGLPQPLQTRVYSPDSYVLSFSFPTPKRISSGAKWIENWPKAYKKSVQNIKPIPLKYPFENPSSIEASEETWGKLDHPLAIGSMDRPLKFEKNGQAIELSVLDAFASVILLQKKIWGIKELIMQAIPKAGIYFDGELKLFEGKCVLAWSWKEYTDHRVYLNMAASIEMTIFEISFEVGIGFSILGNNAQAYFTLAGALTVSLSVERISPDNSIAVIIPVTASITGTVGIRANVVFVGTFNVSGSTALEFTRGEFKISTESGASFKAGIKWTGLKGAVSMSAGAGRAGGDRRPTGEQTTGIDYTRERVWIEEHDWGWFEFPAPASDPLVRATDQHIQEIFSRVFSANDPLVVRKANGITMSNNEIAMCFIDRFRNRNDIDKRDGSLKLLAIQIKAALQDKITGPGQVNGGIEEMRMRNFSCSNDFEKMLDAM